MKTFDYQALSKRECSQELCTLITQLREDKGRLAGLRTAYKNEMEHLAKEARFQNVNASGRIEGIYLDAHRIRELLDGAEPTDDRERQTVGYAHALDKVEREYAELPISAATIVSLHTQLFGRDAKERRSSYRKRDYTDVVTEAGLQRVKVSPITAFETPLYLGAACDNLASSIDAHQCNPLILIPCFTIDFLCIRPFDAGTGRLSRLIGHFLLLRAGFDVVRYQSLDALCEQSGMAYYDALNACVEGWDRNANNYEPFERYWLTMLHNTYEALFQRLESKLPEDSANKMDRIRAYCLRSQGKLTKQDLISAFPDTSVSTIENALHSLIDDGTLRKVGAGRATAYEVAGN